MIQEKLINLLNEYEDDTTNKGRLYCWVIKDILGLDLSDSEIMGYLKDVTAHGCVSGTVSSLVYYRDTEKFYAEFKEGIFDILCELKDSCGYDSVFEALGNNQQHISDVTRFENYMAWFAYEWCCSDILNELEAY